MNTQRVQRLIQTITALHTGRSLTVEDLAGELGVTRRTVFRDLDVLEKAGVPFKYDRIEKRYKIDRDYFIPPISFTLQECLELMFLTQKVLGDGLATDGISARRVAMKIESALPTELQRHCGSILKHMDFRRFDTSQTGHLKSDMVILQEAVVDHRKVAVSYESPVERQPLELVLHPYHLVYLQRAWYVVGFSELHRETRTFKLERILKLEPKQELFIVDAPFDLSEYFGLAWNMIRGQKRYCVRIQFSAKVATNVEEVMWHKSQATTRESDGSLIWDGRVDGVEEISWWVLGYGDQAKVMEPPELRHIIAERAANMVRMYQT